MSDDPETTGGDQERDDKGRFVPGKSGNPSGRPKGSRHKAILAAEALLDGEAETLTRKVIELAKDGDGMALKLCLDRLLPPRRERPIEAQLPSIETPADLPKVTATLLGAASSGELAPTEAEMLSKLVETHRRVVETAELEQRITALEQQAGDSR